MSMNPGRGHAVERRVRQVAAVLGVPEFVYSVPLISKGASVREVGDGILFCGSGGAILQVKSRSLRAARLESESSAVSWSTKHIDKAVRQGRGSRRTIVAHRDIGNPLSAVPVRALILGTSANDVLRVTLDADCAGWPIIVVVDHPRN
jgi:hypothetical protein